MLVKYSRLVEYSRLTNGNTTYYIPSRQGRLTNGNIICASPLYYIYY